MAEKLGPIPPNEGRNWTGICHLDVLAVQDVLSVPDEVDGRIATAVVPMAGANWVRVYFEEDGGNWNEKWPLDNGAQSSRATVSGQVLRDQLPYLRQFWAAKGRRYIVLATTRNGDMLLMGTKAAPAMLLVTERAAGEEIGSDTNHYKLSFSLASRRPVPFYTGTPPPAIAPGDNCPSLAALLPTATTAEIIAGITGQQAEELADYFGANCPTLADLLATVSDAALYAALSPAQATYIANELINVIDGNADNDDVIIDPGGGSPPPSGAHYSPAHYAAAGYKTT